MGPAIDWCRPRWQPAQLTRQDPATACLRDRRGPPTSEPASGTCWGLRRRHCLRGFCRGSTRTRQSTRVPQESLLSSRLWKHYSLSLSLGHLDVTATTRVP